MNPNTELVRQLLALLDDDTPTKPAFDNGMVGKYVIVRCTGAGVHAGKLVSHNGQECVLEDGRRLWYWKVPAGKPAFLSGIAQHGLGEDCKIGCPVQTHLTENCEILECSVTAERSIRGYASHGRTN